MSSRRPDPAVAYFSENASQFHGRYQDQPEFQERLVLFHELLARYAKPDALCLDLGCGSGVFSFYLAGLSRQVIGVDGAENMIALCDDQRERRGIGNVRFVRAFLPDVNEVELAGADLIVSSSVVEYVEDLDRTLALFARLLKPRGTLVISMPNVASISRTFQRLKYKVLGQPETYRYIRHFSLPRMLGARLRPLGFTPLESHYYTHFTRLSLLGRKLGLPSVLTEDLFVTVFRKA